MQKSSCRVPFGGHWRNMKTNETLEQIAVADYLRLKKILFIHIPNEGKRSVTVARILKAMGLQPGFPDLLILEPRGSYHALAIEMKTENGRLTENQREWLNKLRDNGYFATACWGADEAITVINTYMSLK